MEFFILSVVIISIILITFNYIIYPLLVIFISKIFEVNHDQNINYSPTVSFIIAAYNEERVIRRKIENTLTLNYPSEKLQIIVISDGSTDRTRNIADEFASKGVISLHSPERAGKSAAINRAVSAANGEVLVFSDANNDYSTDAIMYLMSHFTDATVGAVTGSKRIYENRDRESAKGDGLYWHYESAIKEAESKLGSITAAEGEILAVRKSQFVDIPTGYINDDAAITFNIVKSGHRVLYESRAIAYEEASINLADDFHVKVRMATGGFQTFTKELIYLLPPRSLFSISFLSHKLLRWLSPHFLILILIGSLWLADNTFFAIFLLLQLAFYILALYGWFKKSTKDLPTIIYIPMYFCSMNLAMLIGFIRFITKTQSVNWHKAER